MYQLFKGFVQTRNKKCIEPFKGKSSNELMGIRQARKLDEYAGILNDNTILIDIDNYDQSEILMQIVEDLQLNCRVYETKRGKHFLFKNDEKVDRNRTGATIGIGIKADIKIGSKNSYSVLKYEGKERRIIYDIENDEEYQTLPIWLKPIKTKTDFASLKEGDGRNQEFFNYILTLQSFGFSKEAAKTTIELINKYVLPDPLKAKELETILRDEAFQKPIFYDGKTFLHDKFAQFLISEYHIIKINGVLHYFKDGVYTPANIDSLMIKHISGLKQQQRKEVLLYLQAYITKNTASSPANYIAFANGIYNILADELEEYAPDKIITNRINWNYNPKAESELAEDVINKLACQDHDVVKLLQELIGYTFYRRNELRKAFMLKGKRHNGKSTFLSMLQFLLGEDNTSALDLSDLSHEYKAAGLFGKLANIGDDIEDEFIPSAGIFKKVVSGDRMNCNVKFAAPIEFNPYCKLIFSGNTIPRLGRGRDSAAIVDRIVIIPFNASFKKGDSDFSPFIKYKLRSAEVMEYLIRIGMEGLKRVLDTNEFTTTKEIDTEIQEYEMTLDPIQSFFEEVSDGLENESTKKCYRLYSQFCYENALKPISHIEFIKRVKEYFGYEITRIRVSGKPTRVFIKKGDADNE